MNEVVTMTPVIKQTTRHDKRKIQIKLHIYYTRNSMYIFKRKHNSKIKIAPDNIQSKQINPHVTKKDMRPVLNETSKQFEKKQQKGEKFKKISFHF